MRLASMTLLPCREFVLARDARFASSARFATSVLCAALVVAYFAPGAQAQQRLYKLVGPNGEITYTDRPPPVPAAARVDQPRLSSAPPTASLPADLADVVKRYPVTLHTSAACGAPCDDGRKMLRERGIPHNERTISTPRDSAELTRLAGSASLPMLMVGRQPLVGFRQNEWIGYLDAAGYPATSRLPATYAFGAPAPLTRPVAEPPRSVDRPVGAAPAEPPPPGPGAGGIRF